MPEQHPEGAVTLDASTSLAFERTRVAYERTMMAWIRTATSLITFGFSIYKLFQLEGLGRKQPGILVGPREFSSALVALGLVSLVLATIEHRRNIRTLGAQYAGRRWSLAVILGALISLLGIVALLAIVFRK